MRMLRHVSMAPARMLFTLAHAPARAGRLARTSAPPAGRALTASRAQGSPSWVTVANVAGAAWQLGGFAGAGPFDVRITLSTGPALLAACAPPAPPSLHAHALFWNAVRVPAVLSRPCCSCTSASACTVWNRPSPATCALTRRGAVPVLAVGDYPAAFSPAQAAADTALPVPVGQQVTPQPAAAPAQAPAPSPAALPRPPRAAAGLHSGATLSW